MYTKTGHKIMTQKVTKNISYTQQFSAVCECKIWIFKVFLKKY